MDDDTELTELEEPCACGDIAEETTAVEVADAPDDEPAQPVRRPRRKRRCHCTR